MIEFIFIVISVAVPYGLYMYKTMSDAYDEAMCKISLLEDEIDRLEQLVEILKSFKGRIPREDER